jgi:hypothetical protein
MQISKSKPKKISILCTFKIHNTVANESINYIDNNAFSKQLLASLERRFYLQFLASPRCLQMNVSHIHCEAKKGGVFACFAWKLNSKDQERIKPNETPGTSVVEPEPEP